MAPPGIGQGYQIFDRCVRSFTLQIRQNLLVTYQIRQPIGADEYLVPRSQTQTLVGLGFFIAFSRIQAQAKVRKNRLA